MRTMTWHKVLLLAGMLVVFIAGRAVAADKPNPAQRVNILFCLADDASHFGATGCSWVKTPNIDRLAQRGLIFDNVYTPTAK